VRRSIEELDRQATRLGEISLRRRWDPSLDVDVHEVRLDDEFLMSSLFTVAEEQLADLGLAEVDGTDLDVLVGGLGLGYTAGAALADSRVRSVHVVEALGTVIDWHRQGLLPSSPGLVGDNRCHLVEGDFFAWALGEEAVAADGPESFHAVLVDIDHSPRQLLHAGHAAFYEPAGLATLARRITPGGVFGLWSDEPPDDDVVAALSTVFASCAAHVVPFANPYTGGESTNTVYVATTAH
jgi:spermidine synthase